MSALRSCRSGATALLLLLRGALAAAGDGAYVTSMPETATFQWGEPVRSVREAVGEVFAAAASGESRGGPSGFAFAEGRSDAVTTQGAFMDWVEHDLLLGPDPFADFGGRVPVPWPGAGGDQLSSGHYVAYSRRQLCFIIAKSLTGAETKGYANGLRRYLDAPGRDSAGAPGCTPRTGDFGRGLLAVLEACAADPGLAGGRQGPILVVAKAKEPPTVAKVREESRQVSLSDAHLRVCQYGDGARPLEGVEAVPEEGCRAPTRSGPGKDFMTGGLEGQSTQDISAAFLGGYVFGNACGLGGGQDERLMTYMPEVGALAFFLSQDSERPQLRQPSWILGARMVFDGLDGTARFNDRLFHRPDVPLTSDLKEVVLKGATYSVSASRPFIAFMSENQGFFPYEARYAETPLARRNLLPSQRDVSGGRFAFEKQVRAWYGSMALTSYHEELQPGLKAIVKSVGTGPWLAGLWWGDSQLGFLAVWLGHALAAHTWGTDLPVDYYTYSAFTENPGNQCFVHSAANCKACIETCVADPLPATSFWMPGEALFQGTPCVPFKGDCGRKGLEHVVPAYKDKTVAELWEDVEIRLAGDAHQAQVSGTVFDRLLEASAETACGERSWPDKDHGLICGPCKVLVDFFDSRYRTCNGYCQAVGRSCAGAWEEVDDDCRVKFPMTCGQTLESSDAICQCTEQAVLSSQTLLP